MAEGESLHHGMKSLGDLRFRLHMSFPILICRDTKAFWKNIPQDASFLVLSDCVSTPSLVCMVAIRSALSYLGGGIC